MNYIKKNIETILYFTFEIVAIILFLSLGGDRLAVFQKVIMLLYVGIAIFFTVKYKDKTNLVYALLFTAMSDNLIITDSSITEFTRTFGMLSFCVAQFIHMLFLNKEVSKKTSTTFNVIRIVLPIVIFLVMWYLGFSFTSVIIVTIIYFVMLLCNVIQSFYNMKKHLLITIGFICFIICDLFVGIDTGIAMGIFAPMRGIAEDIFYAINKSDWVFYLVAQFLFVLFIKENNKQ